MFKNGVGRDIKMIFKFLNGDVIKTSEIALVSRMKQCYRDSYTHKFYYNIIVNSIEIERNLTIYIDQDDLSKQFLEPTLVASTTPLYVINDVEKFDEKIKVQYRDTVSYKNVMIGRKSDLHIVNFAELQCFKNFDQERLSLIEKLR